MLQKKVLAELARYDSSSDEDMWHRRARLDKKSTSVFADLASLSPSPPQTHTHTHTRAINQVDHLDIWLADAQPG